ncbi:MAG: hypothetical protein NVS3B12_11830 [Acidimicrobiales bacterium]
MVEYADETTTELERRLAPLKVVSILESCSYVSLLFFWLSGNRVGTLLLGSIHGMIVMAFAGMVLLIYKAVRWSLPFALLAIATGPIGALMVFARLRREEPQIRARERERVLRV